MALRKAARRTTMLYDQAIAKAGLTTVQYGILAELSRQPRAGLTLHAFSAILVLERSARARYLRVMESNAWVALAMPPQDQRQLVVTLTTVGRRSLRRARPLWAQAQARFEGSMGRQTSRKLRTVLAAAKSLKL